MIQNCYAVGFLLQETSLKAEEALLTVYVFDSHHCPGQNVLAQTHLAKVALASGVQQLVMASMGRLVSRGSCKVMQHDDFLTIHTNNANDDKAY